MGDAFKLPVREGGIKDCWYWFFLELNFLSVEGVKDVIRGLRAEVFKSLFFSLPALAPFCWQVDSVIGYVFIGLGFYIPLSSFSGPQPIFFHSILPTAGFYLYVNEICSSSAAIHLIRRTTPGRPSLSGATLLSTNLCLSLCKCLIKIIGEAAPEAD